jgi:hypothetical protein
MLRWITGHRKTVASQSSAVMHANSIYRTFSPVPKRVMDGSEPGEVVPAAVLSGAPTDLQARTVRYV